MEQPCNHKTSLVHVYIYSSPMKWFFTIISFCFIPLCLLSHGKWFPSQNTSYHHHALAPIHYQNLFVLISNLSSWLYQVGSCVFRKSNFYHLLWYIKILLDNQRENKKLRGAEKIENTSVGYFCIILSKFLIWKLKVFMFAKIS